MLTERSLTEGPFGLKMTSAQAVSLEATLKKLPDTKLRHAAIPQAVVKTKIAGQQQSDISWISTECRDMMGDVVLSTGMNDTNYRLNPIVTLNHSYSDPPIGRSMWRKRAQADGIIGIQAMTVYPSCPASWQGEWPPDLVFSYIQAGLLNAKSVGFLPVTMRQATSKELDLNNWPGPTNIIVEWLLIEYAVGTIPVNPEATVLQISS